MGRSAFLDETIIEVEGGRGGNGSASFLRTRRQPKGGPDGGNGGDGGDVYAVADGSVNSLYDFITKHKFQAQEGGHGGSKKCHGHDGGDLYLKMPVGTDIRDEVTGALHASLLDAGEQVLLVKGGKGGRGNVTFKSSTNRAPRESTLGSEGDKQVFHLSLRILADVGLVGLPNSGKSTFLNSVSNAHAPIGDYPFTTLKPCLGTIELEDYSQLTIADTPGLVDGASRGVGLGARFLRHVSRSKVLLHFVDASCADAKKILGQQDRLVTEIKLADLGDLLKKPRVLVLSKIDLLDKGKINCIIKDVEKQARPIEVFAISSKKKIGIDELVGAAARLVRVKEKTDVT